MKKQSSHTVFIPHTGREKDQPVSTENQRWPLHLLPSGIQARLFGLITLALLPILLLLGWIYNQRYETRRATAMQTELEVARGVATAFATYVEGVHQQNHSVGQAVVSFMLAEPNTISHVLFHMSTQSPAIRNVSWVDPDGTILASSQSDLIGQNLSVRPYFQQVKAGQPWAIGDMTRQGIATSTPTLAIASAIRDENGALRGLIVSGLEPARLNEVTLIQDRPADGTFAIFDRQGVIVYSNSKTQISWDERINWKQNDPILQHVLETGQEQYGLITPIMEEGDWIAARVPIEKFGFVAGARRPQAVAMAPVQRALYQSALIAILVWLMAFLLALLVAQTIAGPLHRLEQDAQRMGQGQLKPHHDPQAPIEVHQVRQTVEHMAAALLQQAEELRERETQFRVLFHNRHTPMLLIDPDTRQIVDANPAASTYYGWSQDELRAMKITEINQLAPDQTDHEMQRARSTPTSKQFHFHHRLASGEIRDVEVSSGPIQVNEKEYLFSIVQDITERVQAERALHERSEGLALLSEAAQKLLSGIDPSMLLDHLYPRLSALIGLDAYIHYILVEGDNRLHLAGVAGIPHHYLAAIDRVPLGKTICGRVAQDRKPALVTQVQESQDPHTALIRDWGFTTYTCYPLMVQDQLVGTLSFGSRTLAQFDAQAINLMNTIGALISAAIHRRQAESTLQVYASKLEESNQELQEFAFIASHDLQEPLRKVETFGTLLLQDSSNLQDTQRDYLERMQQSTGRMRRMVLDLLELSRVNTQGRPFEPVNLTEIAQEVISDLEMQVKRTQGNIVLGQLPEINADPAQMRQLLQNLIGNALKYHRPNVPPQVSIQVQTSPAGRVEIQVEDNGIGFDPNYIDRIFQPFQRLVGKSEYEGTGIGLAICRKITERHQGSITAKSVPGQGSVFIVRLSVHPTPTRGSAQN